MKAKTKSKLIKEPVDESVVRETTPEMVEAIRRKVNKHWTPIEKSSVPPVDTSVLVLCELAGERNSFIGKFFHNHEGLVVGLGVGWPIPRRRWADNGVVAWMPIPR